MPPEGNAPKKYIRTYAADLAAAQSEGTPAAAAAPEAPPLPVQPPVPQPPPPPPQAAAAAPQPEVSPLHTFSGDFSDLVKERNASQATILAAEQDAPTRAPELYKPKERGNLLYIIGGVALLLIGGGGALYSYLVFVSKTAPIMLAPTVSAPIFVDDRQQVTGTGTVLTQAIEQSVASTLGVNSVRLLYTPESVSGTSTVFAALNLPAPGTLLRNISSTGGMAGVVNVSGTQSPFFILSVTSYSDTFAGMLYWEPNMTKDLAALFPPYQDRTPILPPAATTTATTTPKNTKTAPATTTPPVPVAPIAGFRDEVIASHDVRVYRDANSRAVLVYGYWNQSTLIIARDSAAFAEIINRLATSRAQ